MTEDELDDRIRSMARHYHEPPATPRERMWQAIASRRIEAKVVPIGTRRTRRSLGWITALAATFLLGIAVDRLVQRPDAPVTASTTPNREASLALQMATTQYLSRMETFLTGFRIAAGDTVFQAQARDLLTSTRLLLDSPRIQDPKVKSLLEDLELILVQIAQPGAADRPSERKLITDGLQERQVLPRLRSQIPAGQPHFGVS